MNNSGDPVFDDNVDKILSEKIINHTEMSEKEEELKNDSKAKNSFIKAFLTTTILTFVFFTIFFLLRETIRTEKPKKK